MSEYSFDAILIRDRMIDGIRKLAEKQGFS